MSREELERLDDLGMQAWNDQDPEAFTALFADDFVWRDVTLPEPMTTREEATAYMRGWFTAFPDLRSTTVTRVIGEDAVAAELRFTGTNSGPLAMGGTEMPATGKSVVGGGTYFVKVQDGKITEFSTHPDVATMLIQLGVIGQEAQQPSAPA